MTTMTTMALSVAVRRGSLIQAPTAGRNVVPSFRLASSSSTSANQNANANAGPITQAYLTQIGAAGTMMRSDVEQIRLATRLDSLHASLLSTDGRVSSSDKLHYYPKTTFLEKSRAYLAKVASLQPTPPKGLYIHGAVGVGKSFLMDLFHHAVLETKAAENRSVRRVHFHEFMLDVHGRIHRYKQQHPRGDPIPHVAMSLAREARVLCFDEFQVTDIADAMILKRLFEMLIDQDVVVVATSNRAPESLYEGGINRDSFLPFLDTLHASMDAMEMAGVHDYRQDSDDDDDDDDDDDSATTDTTCTTDDDALIMEQCYFLSADATTPAAMNRIFTMFGGGEERSETLSVLFGRTIHVPRANDNCAWLDFDDLCLQPLGSADYLSLCQRFPVVVLDKVPQLNASRFNEARRFVTLIDALYESKTKLVASMDVPIEHLFVDFVATVESHDGDEEIALVGGEGMFVKAEGGSSSSAATTMIRTKDGDVEWSATGRIGVSLAQLSAVRDVSFSFQRAESRLNEMKRRSWGRIQT
jgi:protein AFG1